jgi:hypothetical protein
VKNSDFPGNDCINFISLGITCHYMACHKLIFIFLVFIALSCKKKGQAYTRLYADDGMEVLNGNVKEILIGDSSSKADFHNVYFDRQGNMIASTQRSTNISGTIAGKDTVRDTSVYYEKVAYAFIYDHDSQQIALLGNVVSGNSKHISRFEFDKKGLLIKYDPNTIDTMGGPLNQYKYDTVANKVNRLCEYRNVALEPDRYIYKYDNKHRLKEMDFFEGMPLRNTSYHYIDFDSHNNWIKKKAHWRNFPPMHRDSGTYIITRKITYY